MSDEESHDTSYSTSVESVGDDKNDAEPEEVDIKKTKVYNTLSPWKKFWHSAREFSPMYTGCFLFSLILIGLKYLIIGLGIDKEYPLSKGGQDMLVSTSTVVASLGWGFLGFTAVDCTVYYLSGYLMNKIECLTLAMFYTNGVSTLLTALIFSFGAMIYFKIKAEEYKLSSTHSISLDQILVTVFFVFLLITTKDIFVKRLRMGFNHTNYLTRIQRCLLEHQFVKTLEIVKRRIKGQKGGKLKRYWMFSQPSSQERHSDEESADGTPANETPEDTEKYIKPKTLVLSDETIGTRQKMIIFKEFEKIMNTKFYHMEKGLGFSSDLKQHAQQKAEKIAHWLAVDKKKFQVRHLKKYVDSEYVDKITRILGMQETQPLAEKDIAALIERTRREKYSVKKSLIQMDKALIRVSRFVTATILVFAVGVQLSSTLSPNDAIKSIFGTFFGVGIIFQTSVKNAIDSVIFLFIVHPYDIGDRIRVEIDKEELNMVVTELNVFSTVFYQWDGAKIYIPNHVLLQKPITNVRRSGLMAENIVFQIAFDTPPEKIQHLKTEVSKFIKRHPKDFAPYFMFNYHCIEDTNKLHLKIYLQHATNWQHYEAYLQRKAKFVMFLKQAITEQKIEYYLPVQRIEILKNSKPTASLSSTAYPAAPIQSAPATEP
ncbi:hypothetical protein NEHOM01_0775 [Nematocida homosporus]|uniref:uncharacterized protein n=1 Tax=Nematocida homosporus TaxID=1912981 RepID=UPI00221E52D5|nr:uncharacterized protein NEHOM01_0775 [Nematocida homosporus]KAI5185360.1 hypothetical protein NEHOM01_0775 [Nematocida homosporus]